MGYRLKSRERRVVMKKYVMILMAAAVLVAIAMPVRAETAFNEMSKCVQSWGKGCCEACKGGKTAPKAMTATDALGNKVSTVTDNSGKSKLGT